MLTVHNTGMFSDMYSRVRDQLVQEVVTYRRGAMETLVNAMADNIPVWSGRTLSSMTISNSALVASIGLPPSRREAQAFGQTNRMPLGSEPMRGSAMGAALASLAGVDWGINSSRVTVTINSAAWPLVERGAAPGGPGQAVRNRAVVSRIALAETKAKFPKLR